MQEVGIAKFELLLSSQIVELLLILRKIEEDGGLSLILRKSGYLKVMPIIITFNPLCLNI